MEQLRYPTHQLQRSEFDLLAGARPAHALVGSLRRSRISRSLLLLKYILDRSPDLRPAARLLTEAHDADSAAVNQLLINPWVALWAAVCARDLSHRRHRLAVNAVALAAAARAGLYGRAMVLEPHEGRIMIPSLGMLARGSPGRVTAGDLEGPWWWPIRSLSAVHSGQRITVPLDDVDPYRRFHRSPVQSRLTAAQFDTVAARFRGAWRLLVDRCPRRAAELADGLMSITLLAGRGTMDASSATCAEAFGGMATTMPRDSLEFAVAMVHEFQHSKLAAVASLTPLCTPDADEHTYFAPWKASELRPLAALLQGIYAFTGVALLWRDLIAEPAMREEAIREFAIVRVQLGRALSGVKPGDPGLTAAGRRLVARLERTVKSLAREAVPASVEAHARDRLAAAEAMRASGPKAR